MQTRAVTDSTVHNFAFAIDIAQRKRESFEGLILISDTTEVGLPL